MYCPSCGEAQPNTKFCTKCGHSLALRSSAGRQAFILLALGLLMVPVWMFIGAAFPPADRLVEGSPSTTVGEALAWIAMWVFFLAAFARIAYSLLFERNRETISKEQAAEPSQLNAGEDFRPAQAGRWRQTTADLFEPARKPSRTSGDL